MLAAYAPPSRTLRILFAVGVGTLCALLCYTRYRGTPFAGDLLWLLRGARQLWNGANPYHDPLLGPHQPYPFNDPLFYPLPALFVATPLLAFSPPVGAALFVGLSTGVLAFAIGRPGWTLLPVLLSAPFWGAVFTVQWSPLILATALLPALAPLALAKPNIGLPALLGAPSRRSIVATAAIALFSLLLVPSWPWDWLANVRQHRSFIPALVFPGPLILLAAWRWRDPKARRLVLLALVPQRAIYDQLLLWTVCRSWKDALALSLSSWLGVIGWWLGPAAAPVWIVAGMYLPALGIVLWPTLAQIGVPRLAWPLRYKRRSRRMRPDVS